MPITRTTDAETQAAEMADAIEACARAVHQDKRMLMVRLAGGYDVYIANDYASIAAAIHDIEFTDDMVPARVVDAYVEAVEGLPGVADIELTVHEYGDRPGIIFVAPGYGRVQMQITQDIEPEKMLKRTLRERRQDSEGRTMTRLGAMTIALAARTPEDVDRIIDTIFPGGDVDYLGVHATFSREGLITTRFEHDGVQMRSDGIEVADLPETVRIAIRGAQRRHLRDVVVVPGFEGLEIAGIGYNAMSSRIDPRRSWVRIDVRDENGAKFEKVEIEEAREIAHAMLARRNAP